LPSCGDEKIFFNVTPIEKSKYENLAPLGLVSPPGHIFPIDHMYFFLNMIDQDDSDSGSIVVEVKMPGDGWITRIREVDYGGLRKNDYSVFFSPCKEVEGMYFHLTALSDKLMGWFENTAGDCQQNVAGGEIQISCEKYLEKEISAGEILGTAGGEGMHAFDLGMTDSRIEPHQYANPNRWKKYFRSLYVVCPIDYFKAEAKKELESKIGKKHHDGFLKRTIKPICGEVMQDIPGTAQGVWFQKGTVDTLPEDAHLSLVFDGFDPTRRVFSIGTSINNVEPTRLYFKPTREGLINRDFNEVIPGKTYCYNTKTEWTDESTAFILEMTDNTTLNIEKYTSEECGTPPWEFSLASVFVR